jgi:hypothetical protein
LELFGGRLRRVGGGLGVSRRRGFHWCLAGQVTS